MAGSILVESNVRVAMRDGVRLATDIYRPAPQPGHDERPLPVLLERTPYDKSGTSRSEITLADATPWTRVQLANYFASHGYVVAMQDCRGRYESEGVFHKYVNEAEDGYDTLAWILEQPWCNGSVGTMGLSYGAHTQAALACLNPVGLCCMFMDSGGFSSAYHGGIRRGGAFELKQATWAYRHALKSPQTRADEARRRALEQVDIADWFRNMPWQPGHSPLAAAPEYEAYLFELWREGRFSDYWKRPGLYAEGYYEQFPDVPTAIVGSWYDPYVLTCITNYCGLAARKRSPVALLMGPWTHGDRSALCSGDADFGPQSTLDGNVATDYRELRLCWFDRWLKGNEMDSPLNGVTYFRMGGGSGRKTPQGRLDHGGAWLHAESWPPAGVCPLTLYLQGNGALQSDAPRDHAQLSWRADPHDPVPTIGGALTSGAPVMTGGAFDQRVTADVFTYRECPAGMPLAERSDVLVFQTEPLAEDLVVSGTLRAEIFVASDCPDTDFTVKLVDVYPPSQDYPEGYAMNITDGILRMRYRDGWQRETMMTAGEVYGITIEPFATSNVFKAGHRLRIDIASSNYPQFDINPNSGDPEGYAGESRVANNSVYVGGQYASRIILPSV